MAEPGETAPAVRFCPFCGQPLGSFFGARLVGGGMACDRCGECFRVVDVDLDEGTISPEAPPGGPSGTTEEHHERDP